MYVNQHFIAAGGYAFPAAYQAKKETKMKIEQKALVAMMLPDTFVPAHLRNGIISYIETGRPVGSFLAAMFCNDLRAAAFAAKTGVDSNHIITIAKWLWNYAPINCHGDENKYRGWMDAMGRRNGFQIVVGG